ncbi:hypothetical protein M0R45_006825 [Rubus argutus]|uniref:Uncharacterized protein n=1 Tax=Rubus argutus TaxID=59490 RepID=A0AAW1YRP9_RUBAR
MTAARHFEPICNFKLIMPWQTWQFIAIPVAPPHHKIHHTQSLWAPILVTVSSSSQPNPIWASQAAQFTPQPWQSSKSPPPVSHPPDVAAPPITQP